MVLRHEMEFLVMELRKCDAADVLSLTQLPISVDGYVILVPREVNLVPLAGLPVRLGVDLIQDLVGLVARPVIHHHPGAAARGGTIEVNAERFAVLKPIDLEKLLETAFRIIPVERLDPTGYRPGRKVQVALDVISAFLAVAQQKRRLLDALLRSHAQFPFERRPRIAACDLGICREVVEGNLKKQFWRPQSCGGRFLAGLSESLGENAESDNDRYHRKEI